MVHLLILCLAVSCALWVLIDVQRLEATVEVKENNLHDFLVLSQGVTSSRSRDPGKTATRLGELLAGRSWESTFATLEPRIVMTGSGPLLRLVKRADGDHFGTGQDTRKDIRDGSARKGKGSREGAGKADR